MRKAVKIATYIFMPVMAIAFIIVAFSLLTYHGIKALFEKNQ